MTIHLSDTKLSHVTAARVTSSRIWRGPVLGALIAMAGIEAAQAQDFAGRQGVSAREATDSGASPVTVEATRPVGGWYAGLKLGVGDPAMSRQRGQLELFESNNGGWPMEFASLEAGGRLTPRWKLGAELAIRAALRLPTGTEAEITNLDAIATYYPTERGLFIRGGVGLAARFNHYWSHEPANDRIGLDLRTGAGYEWLVWKDLTVKAGLDTTRQSYRLGHGFSAWSSYTTLYVGAGWN